MENAKLRKIKRTRSKISGTATRPRLAVFRSLKQINAQLINDDKGVTIAAATGEKPSVVGKLIAKYASEKKITNAVFDRRGKKYHGKIKALADGARENGLKI